MLLQGRNQETQPESVQTSGSSTADSLGYERLALGGKGVSATEWLAGCHLRISTLNCMARSPDQWRFSDRAGGSFLHTMYLGLPVPEPAARLRTSVPSPRGRGPGVHCTYTDAREECELGLLWQL